MNTSEPTNENAAPETATLGGSELSDGLGTLLPCPFCGSEPTRRVNNDILMIECPSCVSVGFHNHVRFGCRADEEWNARVPNAELTGSRSVSG